jgi:hypothetical protein
MGEPIAVDKDRHCAEVNHYKFISAPGFSDLEYAFWVVLSSNRTR